MLRGNFQVFFKDSHEWAPEVAMASLTWAVFLASGPAYKRGQHVAMNILEGKLGEERFRPISFLMHGLILILCVIMAWQGAILATKSIMLGLSIPALEPFPVGYFKLCIPLGVSFFALYALSETLKSGFLLFSSGQKGKALPIEIQSREDK